MAKGRQKGGMYLTAPELKLLLDNSVEAEGYNELINKVIVKVKAYEDANNTD